MTRLTSLLVCTIALAISNCPCVEAQPDNRPKTFVINQALADELKSMVKVDQIAANIQHGPYLAWSKGRWANFQDSVFRVHKNRLEQVLNQYGYPGFSLVGREGATHFWLMVQHCDFDPQFQKRVLEKLEVEVKNNNADATNFALLTDRVRLNTGEKQIYGTQVNYNTDIAQAYPENLADSAGVNQRRAQVGLEPIEEYLDMMSTMHFEMNKTFYKNKGIAKPTLYKEK